MASEISQKYSKALLEVAQESNALESVLAEVNVLTQIASDNGLTQFFANAAIKESDKLKVVESLKASLSNLMQNFLSTLATNGRLSNLTDILDEVKAEADKEFKISDLTATTAVPLTEAQKDKLTSLAKVKFDLNDVTLTNTVDDRIIGGFVLNARGKIIDASVKRQLEQLAQKIK